jgi:hypothetical protein
MKTFESFIGGSSLQLGKVEKALNNKQVMSVLDKAFSLVPKSWVRKIVHYVKTETIDIDKIISFNNRFQVVDKTIKLYKSGVKNIEEIYNRIFPKNESTAVLVFGIILTVIGAAAIIFAVLAIVAFAQDGDLGDSIGIIIIIIAAGALFLTGGISNIKDYKNSKDEITTQKIELTVEKDKKEHIIVVRIDKEGRYTIEEVNQGDW